MQVTGTVASVDQKTSKAGKNYAVIRLAENWGKKDDPNRTTTWYTVNMFKGEAPAVGTLVNVNGRLDAQSFMKRDNTPGVALVILANSVAVVASNREPAPASESASAQRYDAMEEEFFDDQPPF